MTSLPRSRAALAGAVLAAVPAASLVAAVPAHAASHTYVDRAGDVRDIARGQAAPDRSSADILRSVVTVGETRLSVATRISKVTAIGQETIQSTRIWRGQGLRQYRLDLAWSPNDPRGSVNLFDYETDQRVACTGTTRSVSAQADLVRVSIPLSCLGPTSRVRVGVATLNQPTKRTKPLPTYVDSVIGSPPQAYEIPLGSWLTRG